jgi:hypothetical protein
VQVVIALSRVASRGIEAGCFALSTGSANLAIVDHPTISGTRASILYLD